MAAPLEFGVFPLGLAGAPGWVARGRRDDPAAIARALVNRPRVLLADEPTGNLDAATGGDIVTLLRDLNRQEGLTIIMVTHNMEIVAATDRVVRLVQGRVEAPAEGVSVAPNLSTAARVAFVSHSPVCGMASGQ